MSVVPLPPGDHVQYDHLYMLQESGEIPGRVMVNLLIRTYYSQLTTGCGNPFCANSYCVTCNEGLSPIPKRQLGQVSLQLATQSLAGKHHFCQLLTPMLPMPSPYGGTGARLETFQTAFESCRTVRDFSYFRVLVQKVFRFSACLDHSFLPYPERGQPQPDPLIYDLKMQGYLDIENVIQTYDFLLSSKVKAEVPDIRKLLTDSIDANLVQIERESRFYDSSIKLRKFLFLYVAPFLMDSDLKILGKLIRSTLRLVKELRIRFLYWLMRVPLVYFERCVTTLQHFVTMRLYVTQVIDVEIAYGTRVLGLFNEANIHRKPKGRRASYEIFYNDAVNRSVNLMEDFTRWFHKRPGMRFSFNSFCFCDYPFILDPVSKATILQIHASEEKNREIRSALQVGLRYGGRFRPYCILKIDRRNLIQSTIQQIEERVRERDLKKPLKVQFVGEEGVDEGGVRKEFFQLIIREVFDAKFGMFKRINSETQYWFDLNSTDYSAFRLIGQVIGLAIYNKVILDVRFPLCVYRKLLAYPLSLEDLSEIDEELARGIVKLLKFEGNVEEVFCRTFRHEYRGWDGTIKSHDLIPDGDSRNVTNANRGEYVQLVLEWILIKSIEVHFGYFSKGFREVVDDLCLPMFKPEELELLVCGSPKIDFDELEKGCKYGEGYTARSPVIRHLWKILKAYPMKMKKRFLSFCTGSDRVPIAGLGKLNLVIAKNGDDPRRLPTAHTCYNVLLLPDYRDPDVLERNMTTAITHGFLGFGLQ